MRFYFMENVVVHIISHSHWDREWYLLFESHRMQLVELFDNLFDLFENDPEFKVLDGQTIVLDDYLEIRPENQATKSTLHRRRQTQKWSFYILQDDYWFQVKHVLNTLIGQSRMCKMGQINPDWLLPRYLWNMGQAPQILQNQVFTWQLLGVVWSRLDLTTNSRRWAVYFQFSEMYWQGADGSRVLGILFANWYSNGEWNPSW